MKLFIYIPILLLRIPEVQFSSTLKNWSNAGYFRLKIN
jgi:hypothetical protein